VCPNRRRIERRWSHSHLSPTETLYLAGRYGSALAELNPALTPLSARWCVQKSYQQVGPLAFRPGQAHVLQAYVKHQHMCSKTVKVGITEECTPIPDPRSVVSISPPPKYSKRILLPVFTPHTPRTTMPIPTHASRSSAYIHAYMYNIVVVGQSRIG
jgi:hypothetical protein